MILLFALSFCGGALFAASRLGRLPVASPVSLRRVLRSVAFLVVVSAAFGLLIGVASAKRVASGQAWRQIREARQRLDPKSKANDPDYWKRQLAEGEAKLAASRSIALSGTEVANGIARTTSLALFLAGAIGGMALVRFRAEQS